MSEKRLLSPEERKKHWYYPEDMCKAQDAETLKAVGEALREVCTWKHFDEAIEALCEGRMP